MMGFTDNLRDLRREKKLSQEQLAELLNVSRQSVSKWEQGGGYPEMEKLIMLAEKLDISLDELLLDRKSASESNAAATQSSAAFTGEWKIVIQSYDGDVLSAFYKFTITSVFLPAKNEPKYILCGTDKSGFWGDNLITLGWYVTKEDAQKELEEIYTAMKNGEPTYQLKYFAKTKKGGITPKLVSKND